MLGFLEMLLLCLLYSLFVFYVFLFFFVDDRAVRVVHEPRPTLKPVEPRPPKRSHVQLLHRAEEGRIKLWHMGCPIKWWMPPVKKFDYAH